MGRGDLANSTGAVEESAELMMARFDRIAVSDTGNFFDYRGHTWPW